jgi:hypothetical protein
MVARFAGNAVETGVVAAQEHLGPISTLKVTARLCRTLSCAEIRDLLFEDVLPRRNNWHFYCLFVTGLTWPGTCVGAKGRSWLRSHAFRIINSREAQ